MCEQHKRKDSSGIGARTIPVNEAVGTVLAHDITEIRPGEFKGRAFKKGHVVREEDINHLQKLGKENLYILEVKEDEMHEDDASYAIAGALAGKGVKISGEPKEGKINLVAAHDGMLKVNREALLEFNMLAEVSCATIHNNSIVKKGQIVAGTRAIPLVVEKALVDSAGKIAGSVSGVLTVKEIRRPMAGVVITGNEVYYGKVKDAFTPVITQKIKAFKGEIVGIYYAPDEVGHVENRIRELVDAGADLIITTGGMSVDPDDITRFAISNVSEGEVVYGSPVLPGSMFLVAYMNNSKLNSSIVNRQSSLIPILGIPACGMYSNITIFDLILPRVLSGERIGRKELAELGHGGLCMKCDECRYPVCPFGK